MHGGVREPSDKGHVTSRSPVFYLPQDHHLTLHHHHPSDDSYSHIRIIMTTPSSWPSGPQVPASFPNDRIEKLRRRLETEANLKPDDRANIETAISLYQQGKMAPYAMYHIQDGKIKKLKELDMKRPWLDEVSPIMYSCDTA